MYTQQITSLFLFIIHTEDSQLFYYEIYIKNRYRQQYINLIKNTIIILTQSVTNDRK